MVSKNKEFNSYRKIAFMGGAYGNLPAIKACVAEAKRLCCDGIFFLGDSIGFAGHSNETIEYIFDHFDGFIAGNLESQAASGSASCACGYGAQDDEVTGCRSFEYSLKSLSEVNRKKLAELAEHQVISSPLGKILLCHGSPRLQNEFLYESTIQEDEVDVWRKEYDVVGIVCTHTGIPWIKQYKDGSFAMNCGVTGKPDNDGDTAVHFGIMDSTTGFSLEIIRVEYDFQSFAAQLRIEGVEEIFVSPLETGNWTCGLKSLPDLQGKRNI